MANGKITIRDVARAAGVSISSVSRYLSDPKSIKPIAAYSIKNAIQDLGYEPNMFASSLKRGHSNTIGVVVPHVEFFFGKACAAISDYFFERNYVAFICETDNDADKEKFFVKELLRHKSAGLIISPCGKNTQYLQEVVKQQSNVILLGREDNIGCDIVTEDHQENAYLLTAHMLEHYPCDFVTVLLGAESVSSTESCVKGVSKAVQERNADLKKIIYCYDSRRIDNTYQAISFALCKCSASCRPAVVAFGADFFEYAVTILNQLGTDSLKKIDIGGYAMRNSINKLGFRFPCITKEPEIVGITAAENLYQRITFPKKREGTGTKTFLIKSTLNI